MNQKQPKTIVIIDDDFDYSELVQHVLSKAGYSVITLTNPQNLLETVKKDQKPDLIILDIMLPNISGLSLLEELKKDQETREISIFCLTNLTEEVGREKALSLGAYSYLTKFHYSLHDIVKHVDFFFAEKFNAPLIED